MATGIGDPRRESNPESKHLASRRSLTSQRSLALDAIRGGLVILMILYHTAYLAVMAGLVHIELFEGFWWVFPRTIAASFIAVSGWSLAAKKTRGGIFKTFLVRAGRLAIPALAITAISALMFRQGFVFFGILHLLAAASILAWPFLGRPALALATALVVLGAGLALGGQRFEWPYLAWLGFRPASLYPVDYLPVLPWFAWCLLGTAARDLTLRIAPWQILDSSAAPQGQVFFLKPLAWAGRHSLGIYLVHLPALYALVSLLALLTRP